MGMISLHLSVADLLIALVGHKRLQKLAWLLHNSEMGLRRSVPDIEVLVHLVNAQRPVGPKNRSLLEALTPPHGWLEQNTGLR